MCVQGLGKHDLWLPRGARDRSVRNALYIMSASYVVLVLLSFVYNVAFMSPTRRGRQGCSDWIMREMWVCIFPRVSRAMGSLPDGQYEAMRSIGDVLFVQILIVMVLLYSSAPNNSACVVRAMSFLIPVRRPPA